ncbi:orotate phosphoribosyltransferase [bacterium]|nr:orotate phosphoribosyltransferase [bacterium]
MNEQEILKIFKETNGYLEGHFKLSSGLHSRGYMQCALVLQYVEYAEKFGAEIAKKFEDSKIDCVVGPAMGGIIIGYETARALGVRSLFTERKDGEMQLRRGFSVKKGEKVLVVEDVITTGGSVLEVIKLLKSMGAEIVGVGSIIDRSSNPVDFNGAPYKALAKIDIETFHKENCPMCADNIGIDSPGSKYYEGRGTRDEGRKTK